MKLYIRQQPQQSKYAVVSFSNQVNTEIQFNSQNSWENLFNAIDNIALQNAFGADAVTALQRCSNILPITSGLTSGLDSQIVFITDAASNDQTSTINQAITVNRLGLDLSVIGIGSNVNLNELQAMSSQVSGITYTASNVNGLFNINGLFTPFVQDSCISPFVGKFAASYDIHLYIAIDRFVC